MVNRSSSRYLRRPMRPCRLALQAAPGQRPRPLARHKQSTGLFVSGLGLPHRQRLSAPGQKVLTVQGTIPRETDFNQTLCADMQGFSLHAAVRCAADDCQALERLVALVPRPRPHLIRFHGVLAPNARLRAQVVPQEPQAPAQAAPPAECEAKYAHHRPVRLSWARLLKRVFEIDLEHCLVDDNYLGRLTTTILAG